MQVIGLAKDQEKSPSFKATLNLPLSPQAARGMVRGVESVGQFPIGGPDRWRQIVENLAHLVAVLDRSFVPEVEAMTLAGMVSARNGVGLPGHRARMRGAAVPCHSSALTQNTTASRFEAPRFNTRAGILIAIT
jgi:hypothetical protein